MGWKGGGFGAALAAGVKTGKNYQGKNAMQVFFFSSSTISVIQMFQKAPLNQKFLPIV